MQDSGNPSQFQDLLLAYLLDELPPRRRSQVETKMLADEDFLAALKDAQYDLLDAYAAGDLPEAQRERVYRALVANSAAEARFAQVLQRRVGGVRSAAAGSSKAYEIVARSADTRPLPGAAAKKEGEAKSWWVPWKLRLLIPTAALLVLSAAIGFLVIHRAGRQTAVTAFPGGSLPAPKSPPTQQASNRSEAGGKSTFPIAPRPADRQILTFLLPDTLRGTGNGASRTKLFPETKFLRVEWLLPPDLSADEARQLQLEVADRNKVVATIPRAKNSGKDDVAAFLVPAKAFTEGSYLLRVMDRGNSAQGPQVFAENSIEITR